MSRWVFDLGNTRLKGAPVQADGRLGEVRALAHGEGDFADALDAWLPARGDSACVANVASPSILAQVVEALTTRFARISFARSVPQLAGVRIAYAEASRLGVDRFLALLAAHRRAPRAWLVAGVGTALTLDLIDADGLHHGGRIAPSPALLRRSLHQAAAQLPEQGGRYVEFADDTPDALASGCEGMALALVERSLAQAQARFGETPGLLLHGGGIEALASYFPQATLAPSLVLEGLALWSHDDGAA